MSSIQGKDEQKISITICVCHELQKKFSATLFHDQNEYQRRSSTASNLVSTAKKKHNVPLHK